MRLLRLCLVLSLPLALVNAWGQPVKQRPRLELSIQARQSLSPGAIAVLAKAGLEQPFAPGSYMVQFQNDYLVPSNAYSPAAVSQARASARSVLRRRIVELENSRRVSRGLRPSGESDVIVRDFSLLFNGVAARLDEATAQELKSLPGIKSVSPERIFATTGTPRPSQGDFRLLRLPGVPDDLAYRGKAVVIAVVDTGIDYTHPDLGGCIGPGCKVLGGYDFVNRDSDPKDGHGHGTHVAGIAAANGQLLGVAPEANLLAVKVLTDLGYGAESDVVAGVEWAVANGADVVNMSLGSSVIQKDDPLVEAVEKAVELGVVVVVSAGNSGPDYYTIGSPGVADKALTVGASINGDLADFSSRGPTQDRFLIKPEVVAPGVDIRSTVPSGGCDLCDPSGYRMASGTSMAAPYVAGAAALLLERARDSTPDQVKASLATHARDLSLSTFAQGAGDVDVEAALISSVRLSHGPLAFGLLEPAAPDLLQNVAIQFTNSSTSTVAYDLSFDRPLPVGLNVTPSTNRLVIAPGQIAVLNLGIAIENDVLPAAPSYPCDYAGALLARSGTDTVRIPFALLKGAVFNFTVPNSGPAAGQTDPSPYALMIHDRKGWVQWHGFLNWAAGPIAVILPPADYDVLACYFGLAGALDAGILLKEGLSLNSRLEVTLDAKEAAHLLKFQPVYPPGVAHARTEQFVALLRHKSSGTTLPFHSGSGIHVSSISEEYSLELVMYNDGTPSGKPLFTFHAALPDGVQASKTFQNDPADFRHARIDHSLRGSNTLLESMIFLDVDWLRMVVSVSRLGVRDLYLAVPPGPDFSTGGVSEIVFEPSGRVLYSTARWRALSRSVLASYTRGNDFTPVNSTVSDFIPAAIGPFYWFGRFRNQADKVRIGPSLGLDPFVMRGQSGDYFVQENLAYEIRKDGAPGPVVYPLQGEHLPPAVPVQPGAYTMAITLPDPSHPEGRGEVTARFDTTRSDPDPPYLTAFRLTKRDELSEVLSTAHPRTLRFKAGDNKQLQRVELWLDRGAGPEKLTTTPVGDDEYLVDLPILGSHPSAQLRLELEDSSSNLLRFETVIRGASPDLAIRATGRDKALVGRNARFDVRVSNAGLDSTDSKISLTESVPPGLSFVSATAEDWSCALDEQVVKCERSKPLFAKTETLLSLQFQVGREAYPSVSTRLEVESPEDPTTENNVAVLSADVEGTSWWTGLGPDGGEVYSLAAEAGNPAVLYAGVHGQIYRSADHGASWSSLSPTLPDAIVSTIAVRPGNRQVIFAGTDGAGLWKSIDGGRSWMPVKSSLLEDSAVRVVRFNPGNPETLYAGLVGRAVRSTDGGSTWTALEIDPLPVSFADIAVSPLRSSTLYAGTGERIYVSTDGGDSWRVSHELRLGPRDLLGGSGSLFNLDRWLRFAFDPDDPLTVWANGLTALYKTTDGGVTWEKNTVPPGFLIGNAISISLDPQRTIYLGYDGRVARSTDRGNTWEQLPVAESGFIDDLLVAGDGRIFAANAAGVQTSSNRGDSWVECGGISAIRARALALDPNHPGSLLAATNAGFVSSAGGTDWVLLDSALVANAVVVDPHSPGTIYAAGAGVWKSRDKGKSWEASSDGLDGTMAMHAISTLVPDPHNPGHLYIGTAHQTSGGDGIFKSTDGGGSWAPANSGLPAYPGVSCLVIDPASGYIFAGITSWGAAGAGFGLYRSVNRGARWDPVGQGLPRARINTLAFVGDASSRTLFAGTEGAGVYRSDDGGLTWKPAGRGLPEAGVIRAIAVDSGGILYAAGYGSGVFVSRDGGDNWLPFATGLSSVWVTSLVVDPSDSRNIYVASSTGVFAISIGPDLAITTERSAKLLAGGAGVWSVNVANDGSGASGDAIAVDLQMPGALRLLKSSGFGWSCTETTGSVRCSTAELIAPGASAPALRLTYEIDEHAPSPGTGVIRVDASLDISPANDSVTESLEIAPSVVSWLSIFRSNPSSFLGLALANQAAGPADVVLTALDDVGDLLALPDNPVFLSLEPGMQLAELSSEVFGDPEMPIEQGWVRVASDQPVGTTFQFGAERQLDGGVGSSKQEKVLYFTRACSGPAACSGFPGRTLLGLANPNSSPVTIRAQLFSTVAQTEREILRVIPGKACLIGDLSELFSVETVKDGFVRVEVLEGEGIVGSQLVELTQTASLISLPAQVAGTGASLYSAQFAEAPGLSTGVRLVNTGLAPRTLQLNVIGDDGSPLASPKELRLDGMTSLEGHSGDWFDWLPGKQRVGSLTVVADGPGVIGSVLFGDPGGETNAALPLDPEPVRQATFSQVANGKGVYTGIAMFNPGSEAVEVTLRVFTAEGVVSGEAIMTLQPGSRLSKLASDLLPMTEGQIGGYITLTASGPVVAQELFGGDGFLSAVPPSGR